MSIKALHRSGYRSVNKTFNMMETVAAIPTSLEWSAAR